MFRVRLIPIVACAALALAPARAFAQTSSDLVSLMKNLFLQSVVLSKTTDPSKGVIAHDPIFANDPLVTPVTDIVQQISSQIGSQVSNVPLGSSSGGFTYKYDSSLGTFKRTTDSFGPAFAERAVTVGRGKASFGMNYQHSRYSSLDDKDLQSGAIAIFLPHQKINNFPEGDMIEADLEMKLTSDAAVFFGNYGVTERLDVALVLPIEHVNMDLTYHAIIRDFATRVVSPSLHLFSNGQKTQDFSQTGSASGIGDIVVRGKYNFTSTPSRGLALGIDLRLPSGDSNNMLGTGATQTEIYLIASGIQGKMGHHANVGFTASSDASKVSKQANYVGGIDYAVAPKVTIVADFVGRTFINSERLIDTSFQHSFQQGVNAAVETVTLNTVAVQSANLASLLGTAGVKFNPGGNLLVSAHLVLTLNKAGLHRQVTGVVGFDYSF